MIDPKIAADIERGFAIKSEVAALTEELKAIEKRLENAGLNGEQIPLQDANREGKQFLARSNWRIVPVRFESDLIAASFDPDSTMHQRAAEIAGDLLPRYFKQSTKFARVPEDGEDFRILARELLEPDQFAALIQAVTQRDKKGIAKSKIVVGWKDAKAIEAIA